MPYSEDDILYVHNIHIFYTQRYRQHDACILIFPPFSTFQQVLKINITPFFLLYVYVGR